jgi:hypothetical protein
MIVRLSQAIAEQFAIALKRGMEELRSCSSLVIMGFAACAKDSSYVRLYNVVPKHPSLRRNDRPALI